MKIIQLLARVEGAGVTRYTIELGNAMKELGHEVEVIYVKAHDKPEMVARKQNFENITEYDYSDETVKHINEADLVIINSIISKKADEKYKTAWYDMVQNKITTKKVIVLNDHKASGTASYYGTIYKNEDFWLSFDHICTFSPTGEVPMMIKRFMKDENEFTKRYIHLLHPYKFDDTHNTWQNFSDKKRRVTYLGSQSLIKDPMRILRGREHFYRHDYELEYRGIMRTINMATQPDLIYSWDENGNKGPSKACIWADDKKWRLANNIALDDNMIDTKRQKNWIYIFGEFIREEGLYVVSKSAFGCNFFNLKNPINCGDNLEYSIFEMIDRGTIPLLDYDTANNVYLYVNGEKTNKTLYDLGLGVFLKMDLSNAEECMQQMDKLMNDENAYNEMRNKLFDYYKQHCDPLANTKKFIEDCMS